MQIRLRRLIRQLGRDFLPPFHALPNAFDMHSREANGCHGPGSRGDAYAAAMNGKDAANSQNVPREDLFRAAFIAACPRKISRKLLSVGGLPDAEFELKYFVPEQRGDAHRCLPILL